MDRATLPLPLRLSVILPLFCALLAPVGVRAAPESQEPLEVTGKIYTFGGRGQVLKEVQVADETGAWDLKLQFNIFLRYRWHAPKGEGEEVLIALDPVRIGRSDLQALRRIDNILIDEEGIPVEEVRYEPSPELDQPLAGSNRDDSPAVNRNQPIYITVGLKRKLRFEVIPGGDNRSVTLRIYRPADQQM